MPEQTNTSPYIDYDDLRGWLANAERLGEVRKLNGASWQKDMGLVAEAILRAENGPCVVFDDVPGCPKGFRMLLNMFAAFAARTNSRPLPAQTAVEKKIVPRGSRSKGKIDSEP